MEKFFNEVKQNLPCYVMIFMVFFAACNYIPLSEGIIIAFISGVFTLITVLIGVANFKKSEATKFFEKVYTYERRLFVLKRLVEANFKNHKNLIGQPAEVHNFLYDSIRSYNNVVFKYRLYLDCNPDFYDRVEKKYQFVKVNKNNEDENLDWTDERQD